MLVKTSIIKPEENNLLGKGNRSLLSVKFDLGKVVMFGFQ